MTGCRIGKVRMKNGGAELRIFSQAPTPPNGETVAYLETALRRARRGELQSVALTATTDKGYVTTAYVKNASDNPVLLLGGVQWLSDRIMEAVYDTV